MVFFKFWWGLFEGFPMLTKQTLEVIVPFPTIYLCEAGFFSLMTMKTKRRSCLVAKHDIRGVLSGTPPRFSEIVRNKQV